MKKVTSFSEYMVDEERVSVEERELIQFEKELILKMSELRHSQGLSQRELAEISGVKQPALARLESMKATPRIDTVLRLLIPLGYTLEIVPLDLK